MNNFNQNTQPTYGNLDNIFNPGYNNNLPVNNKNYTIVTSLQEALAKTAPYNSTGLYLHQDGEYEFEIRTDTNGRKTYEIFKRVKCTNDGDVMMIPKNEYNELKCKISKLEEAVYGPKDDTSNGATALQ